MPKPVICMIRGICVGGGCELSMAADLRIAATGSTFGVPVAKIGVLVGYNEMRRLLHLVGPGHAANLLLTARRVDEQEALRIGLVTEVVDADQLVEHTYGLAREMATYAPLTQSGHKRIVRTVLGNPSLTALTDEERELPLSIFDTEDGQEGYKAFMEKRPPRFQGTVEPCPTPRPLRWFTPILTFPRQGGRDQTGRGGSRCLRCRWRA